MFKGIIKTWKSAIVEVFRLLDAPYSASLSRNMERDYPWIRPYNIEWQINPLSPPLKNVKLQFRSWRPLFVTFAVWRLLQLHHSEQFPLV